MTTNEAKEVLNGIKSYENTLDLIENHSVSVQDACAIGINAIEEVNRYKKAIEDIKAEINTPNRNMSDYFIVDQIEKIVNEVSR